MLILAGLDTACFQCLKLKFPLARMCVMSDSSGKKCYVHVKYRD